MTAPPVFLWLIAVTVQDHPVCKHPTDYVPGPESYISGLTSHTSEQNVNTCRKNVTNLKILKHE